MMQEVGVTDLDVGEEAARIQKLPLSICVSGFESRCDDGSRSYVAYEVVVQKGGVLKYSVWRRYSQFHELQGWLRAVLEVSNGNAAHRMLAVFPPKVSMFSLRSEQEIAQSRVRPLSDFLQRLSDFVRDPANACFDLMERWQLALFLELPGHMAALSKLPRPTVWIALPDMHFEPTSVAVPWKCLRSNGVDVRFTTAQGGEAARADELLLNEVNKVLNTLRAKDEAIAFYRELEQCDDFLHPVSWKELDASDVDAIIIPGGHKQGVKQMLEDEVLQQLVARVAQEGRVVAAIAQGTLLPLYAGVSKDKRQTTYPAYVEKASIALTKFKYGNMCKTYPTPVEDIVRAKLQASTAWDEKPDLLTLGGKQVVRPDVFTSTNSTTHAVRDDNYISARWAGDAYRFAEVIYSALKEKKQ